MKKLFFVYVLFSQLALAQGWQEIGPDSVNWRGALYLTARWLSSSSFHLAASTSEGVVVYSSPGKWNYVLRNHPESIVSNGVSYAFLEFSPWEPDSRFVGHYIAYTEADLHITKIPFPPSYSPAGGGAHGPCWGGPLSLVIPPNNDSVVYAGLCGVQKSTDRGHTWESLLLESTMSRSRLVGVDFLNANILYRGTELWQGGVLYRSTNSGVSWDSVFAPLPTSAYYGRSSNVIACGDTILLGMRSFPFDTSSMGGIVLSTNAGTTWAVTYDRGRVLGLAGTARSIFAAVTAGIIRSTDWGTTWAPFNNTLPTPSLSSLVADPNGDTVYVSTTTHGVLKVWSFTTAIKGSWVARPTTLALYQNYPNPFNPATTISFDLPQRSHAILRVYDVLGRQVTVLVDAIMELGRHEVSFNTPNLASGVYFYRLSANGFVQSRKMILQK